MFFKSNMYNFTALKLTFEKGLTIRLGQIANENYGEKSKLYHPIHISDSFSIDRKQLSRIII